LDAQNGLTFTGTARQRFSPLSVGSSVGGIWSWMDLNSPPLTVDALLLFIDWFSANEPYINPVWVAPISITRADVGLTPLIHDWSCHAITELTGC
jgi:hypothetical protein